MAATTPPYFHVVATLRGQDDRLIFADQTAAEIRKDFVRPYKSGNTLLLEGEVVDFSMVSKLKIVKTDVPKDVALEKLRRESNARIDRINADPDSGVTIISAGSGWDDVEIADVGEDVTAEFISGAPGAAPWWKPIVEHPYVSTIVGGIVTALILAWVFGIGK